VEIRAVRARSRPTRSEPIAALAAAPPGPVPSTDRAVAGGDTQASTEPAHPARPWRRSTSSVALLAIIVATMIRVWQLDALGINSDEAVYAGQAAAIAGDEELAPFFPAFRAHPLLFQALLSIPYRWGVSPLTGRLLAVMFGVGTVVVTWALARRLYGPRVAVLAALFLALMPYHVVVSRQVLLDGPTVFFSTLSLYLVARFAAEQRAAWLYAASVTLGVACLTKETSILLLGGVYAFLALSPAVRIRLHQLLFASLLLVTVVAVYPASVVLSGRAGVGQDFLAWQLFRRANHPWTFYPATVPAAMGFAILVLAVGGLWLLRRQRTWREVLLLCWIVVPTMFFQLWPTKGFQYLLFAAPPVAVLAARGTTHLLEALRRAPGSAHPSPVRRMFVRSRGALLVVLIVLSIGVPAWQQVQPSSAGTTFLAGTGGVPGGRETGLWVAANVPVGAELLAIGPSMANIVEFYGHRRTYGLSVSPNPLHRNPVYEPVSNPDLRIRNNDLQYLIWDAYSAARSPFFSQSLLRYVERYNGRPIHTETLTTRGRGGARVESPVIVVYEVRP
jgi:hypothetical protein